MKTGAVVLALSLLSGSAFANTDTKTVTIAPVCVEIDLEHDTLRDEERAMAKRLLERVLERENQLVLQAGCTDRYRISHERSSERIVILMKSDAGGRKLSAATLDELSERYAKMVRSLLEAKASAVVEQARTATMEQARATAIANAEHPTAAEAVAALAPIAEPSYEDAAEPAAEVPEDADIVTPDRMLYMRLGLRPSSGGGTGGAIGYRRELAKVSLDFSIGWLTSGGDSRNSSGASFGFRALHVTSPTSIRSFYAGGGLSLGIVEQYAPGNMLSGIGPQAELTAGFEFARDSTRFRPFVQADVTLPFYELEGYSGMTAYAPAFVLSFGVGR